MDFQVEVLPVDGVLGRRVEVELSCLELGRLGSKKLCSKKRVEEVIGNFSWVHFHLHCILGPCKVNIGSHVLIFLDNLILIFRYRLPVGPAIGSMRPQQVNWALVESICLTVIDFTCLLVSHQIRPVPSVLRIVVVSYIRLNLASSCLDLVSHVSSRCHVGFSL